MDRQRGGKLMASGLLALCLGSWSLAVSADQAPAVQQTTVALESQVQLEFDEVPFRSAVQSLGEQAGLPIVWDEAALAEANIAADESVAIVSSQPVSLRRALRLVLEPLYLTWEDEGDRLRVTTRQSWNQRVVTVQYPVADLLVEARSGEQLLQAIERRVAPGTWDTTDQPNSGRLAIVAGELQVTQRRVVQAEVEAFLAELRAAGQRP